MTNFAYRPLIGMTRRRFLGSVCTTAALGMLARFRPALAEGVEPQLSMMGWADYISPDDIWRDPSVSMVARSPLWNQSPLKLAAVFSGSLK